MYYINDETGSIYTGDMQEGDRPLTQEEEKEFLENTKKEQVRMVRSEYFEKYVDWYQSKPLLWEELTEQEKVNRSDYRKYLMDYTSQENWWEQNPLTYEEWLVAFHPVEDPEYKAMD